MQRKNGIAYFIVIALLLLAVVGLNYFQSRYNPSEDEIALREERQEAALAAKAAAKPIPQYSAKNPPPHIQPPPHINEIDPSSFAPVTDETLGNPNASRMIAIGYTMDTPTERNLGPLNTIIGLTEKFSSSHPNIMVKIVCLDLPADQLTNPADQKLPLGLSIDGKVVGGCDTNPGEGLCDDALVQTVLSAVK